VTRTFAAFATVDWSGQNVARPKGLAVATAGRGTQAPVLLRPAGGWTRDGILAEMLRLAEAQADILIALDLSPALPFVDRDSYFPGWGESPKDARALWRLVDGLSGADPHLSASGFLADSEIARHFRFQNRLGDLFPGGVGRLRQCERGQRVMGMSPSSCFNLVGAAQVGKSSLTGMRVLHRLNGRVPVWPFDPVPDRGPLIVEIYTSIAARAAGIRKGLSKIRDRESLDTALSRFSTRPAAPMARYDDHSTDAVLTTAWLRHVVGQEELWHPPALTPHIAATEGWTFGVP
jgi:hypothetical protein